MKETLRLVPLEDTVVFPNMNVTLAVDVGTDDRVLLMPRHGTEFASVGVIAEVTDRVTLPGGGTAVSLFATGRGVAGAAHTDASGTLRVQVEPHPDGASDTPAVRQLEREYRAVVEEILELRGADERIATFVRSISSPGALADTAGYSPELSYEEKVELLAILDVEERLARALALQHERLAELQVRKRLRDDVDSSVQKQQREFVLAPAARVDPTRAGRRRRLGARRVPNQAGRCRHARRRSRASRTRARPARAHRRHERRGFGHPHLPRLAPGSSVGAALRRSARCGSSARDPRRGSRGSRRDEGARARVSRRSRFARRARNRRRRALGRDSDARGATGHGQDLDRRVDRTLARA